MIIRDWMKKNVISISDSSTIRQAASLFAESHVGLLPIINPQGQLRGVIRLQDVLSLELPDFYKLLPDFDFVHNFGAVESHQPTAIEIDCPVTTLMQPALFVEETSGLLRTYALMLKHDLYDLPIVNANRELVGIASRVDVGTALLSSWKTIPEEKS